MVNDKKESILVGATLEGEDLARFRRYKDREKIRANAAAGYKLMAERLSQVEEQQQAPATA